MEDLLQRDVAYILFSLDPRVGTIRAAVSRKAVVTSYGRVLFSENGR